MMVNFFILEVTITKVASAWVYGNGGYRRSETHPTLLDRQMAHRYTQAFKYLDLK